MDNLNPSEISKIIKDRINNLEISSDESNEGDAAVQADDIDEADDGDSATNVKMELELHEIIARLADMGDDKPDVELMQSMIDTVGKANETMHKQEWWNIFLSVSRVSKRLWPTDVLAACHMATTPPLIVERFAK